MSKRNIQDGRSTRKKSKNSRLDRISDLPELVTSHILSLMPTKDAVRTSVLSKDWEHKWTTIYNIDIDDTVLHRQQGRHFRRMNSTRDIVANFVDRVVLLSHRIQSFRLSLSNYVKYDTDQVAGWIRAVSKGNVESLVVKSKYFRFNLFLPGSLFCNASLRNLELYLRCTLKVPARISAPNLKKLNLCNVMIVSDSSTGDTLTLSFPLLETFILHNCQLWTLKTVEIHAPALTKFHRTLAQLASTQVVSIKIMSTRLVEFRFSGNVAEKFILIGQQVAYATLCCDWSDSQIRKHAQTLLNDFSNLKELNISSSLTKAIAQSSGEVSLPVLRHMVRLNVTDYSAPIYAEGLLGLLHATPFLKFLKLYLYVEDNDGYDCNVVEHVPYCIEKQLQEIEFQVFSERSLQVNLVKFLIKNGRALKKVHVSCSNIMSKKEKSSISTQLSSYRDCSTTSSVVIKFK